MLNSIEFYTDAKGEHRWRLRADENGQVMADSGEGYENFDDCLHGAARVTGRDEADLRAGNDSGSRTYVYSVTARLL